MVEFGCIWQDGAPVLVLWCIGAGSGGDGWWWHPLIFPQFVAQRKSGEFLGASCEISGRSSFSPAANRRGMVHCNALAGALVQLLVHWCIGALVWCIGAEEWWIGAPHHLMVQ